MNKGSLKPDDKRLRDRGFKIHSRPASGPVTWERGGEVFVEQEALRIAKRELEADLAKLSEKEKK